MWKWLHSSFIFNSKENRLFFAKCLLMLVLLLLYVLVWVPGCYGFGYTASIIDKIDRLQSIEGPKIVLIGNSNLSYGIRSEYLEQTFGMPVVDMGFHIGAGNIFHENMAKLNAGPGDIYIVCHTSYEDSASPVTNTVEILGALILDRRAWPLVIGESLGPEDWPAILPMIKAIPGYIKNGAKIQILLVARRLGLYNTFMRSDFNQYGDLIAARTKREITDEELKIEYRLKLGPETAARLNDLNAWLAERGAVMLIGGYPIPDGEYTLPDEIYIAFQKDMEERLDCPVISNYLDYMYDYKYIYNSPWHLTDEGTLLRTEQLIKDLRAWMEQTGYRAA